MRSIKSILTVAAVAAVIVLVGAVPAMAQSPFPTCQWFDTNGDGGYFKSEGVALYYDHWYGSHQWCKSPVTGWYVVR